MKIDPTRKKITIDQAVELTAKFWSQYGKPGCSKGHIYNLISSGKLHRVGPPKRALLFEDEVIERLCG
jgi:hypothetical protein